MPGTSSVSASGNQDVDGLLSGTRWATTTLTFGFPTSASAYGYSDEVNTFGVLSPAAQTAVRSILASFESVSNLRFTERTGASSSSADLRYSDSDATATAWAYYPSSGEWGGDVWVRKSGSYGALYDSPVKGSYAYLTYLHETGHALGLKHGHETEGYGALPSSHDSMEYSVMTYRSYAGSSTDDGYGNETWGFAQTLMQDDIAALQYMYGANFTYNSGNTVYTWSSTTGQFSINGVGQGAPGGNRIFMTVWDGGGTDTYDFSNYTTNLAVDLNPGAWTTTASAQLAYLGDGRYAVGNIANALLYQGNTASLIENANGGSGADAIAGNSASNTLRGGGGGDTLDGRDGNDILYGEDGADTLTGGAGADTLDGGTGNDFMRGGTGNDTYVVHNQLDNVGESAGEGTDKVVALLDWTLADGFELLDLASAAALGVGNAAVNEINGNGNANWLDGKGGADIMRGGAGDDTYVFETIGDYAHEAAGDGLDTVIIITAFSYTLTANVERLWLGGSGDFEANGNDIDNEILGNAGNNILNGGLGADTMFGGQGNDLYIIDNAGDVVSEAAGEGTDTVNALIDYTLNVNVENLNIIGTGNINAYGSNIDNVVNGNAGNNTLTGEAGNDTLNGGDGLDNLVGGSGNDTLAGGIGADRLEGGTGNDLLIGGDGDDLFVFGAASGHDTIQDFTAGAGTADRIDLSQLDFADFAAVLAATTDVGGAAVIALSGADDITLTGVLRAQLHENDFIL